MMKIYLGNIILRWLVVYTSFASFAMPKNAPCFSSKLFGESNSMICPLDKTIILKII